MLCMQPGQGPGARPGHMYVARPGPPVSWRWDQQEPNAHINPTNPRITLLQCSAGVSWEL